MRKSFYHGKRVLVTGHTGFKGSWLSLWLKKLGANVTGYALEPPTKPSLFEICSLGDHIESIIGDVRDGKRLLETLQRVQPEIVFHLAAQPLVIDSYKDPVYTYETNIMGTVNVLEAVRNCESVKAVVNVTTDKCYENKESFWGYREDDPLGGFDPYSNSKACSELITASYINSFFNPDKYQEHGVAIATSRAGNVIGGGDFADNRLVPDSIKAFSEGRDVLIRNPRSVRPWQHVLEPLNGYLLLAEKLYSLGPKYNGAWNFGPNEDNEKDVEYIVHKLCFFWPSEVSYYVEASSQYHETSFLKLDSYKARALLGYKPKWHIDRALEMVVEWSTAYYEEHSDIFNFCLAQINTFENAE